MTLSEALEQVFWCFSDIVVSDDNLKLIDNLLRSVVSPVSKETSNLKSTYALKS